MSYPIGLSESSCIRVYILANHKGANDLAEKRNQVNELKKYDPVKMKKNLNDNKKHLAENTSAAEVLQKSLAKTKAENAELLKKITELEAKVAELAPAVEDVEEEQAEAAQSKKS